MKSLTMYQPFLLVAVLAGLIWLCIVPKFLWSAETLPEEPGAEAVGSKEPLPPGTRVYPKEAEKITDRVTFMGSINASYSHSEDRDNNSSDSGGFVTGFLAPGYKFTDSTSLILMYNGSYYKQLNFYSDLVGPRGTDERQAHTIRPMFRIAFGENNRYSLTPSFFYTTTYNKDVESGDWDDGLYNYRDKGGGLDVSIHELGFGGANGTLRFGAEYYEREYPNYTSLLDLSTGLGVEEDERDYDAVLTKIGYNWVRTSGFSWGADYYMLYKKLEDKRVVDSNGVLSSDKQRDYLHSLTLKFWYVPETVPELRLGLSLNGSLYDSNQNYYDGLGTISLADDVPLNDFYDYTSYRINPSISYTFALIPLTPSISYSYQRLDYTDRHAQRVDGTYGNDDQYEIQEEITIALKYALLENLSIYGQYQYLEVDSNNEDESVYRYDHTIDYYYVGISFNF